MLIVFDHQIFSSQKYGGISRYFYELIKHLSSKEGVHTSIVSPLYVNEYIKNDISYPVYGIKIPKFPNSTLITRSMIAPIARNRIKKLHPDIVHETYYSKTGTGRNPAKTILTIYDMTHEFFPEYFSTHDRTLRNKELSIHRADHIICISNHTRIDLLGNYNIEPDKVSTIYLANSLIQSENGPIYNSPYILYVGGRTGYKNFTGFIKAYAQSSRLCNDIHIICFGGGNFTKQEYLLFKSLNINNILHISGNDSTLSNLYKYAGAYICPSLYEGFCLPLVEAMALECPIISSNKSCLPEIASNAAKYFDPYQLEDITNAIECIIYSETESHLLITKGKIRKKIFSWDKCAHQTLNIYMNVLNN